MIALAARCAARPLILHGGLATELSRRGYDLSDPLWSGRVLLDDPGAIEAVHYDYFAAGAEVAITASYQVTYEGMAARGYDAECTTAALRQSVALAQAARRRIERERGSRPERCSSLLPSVHTVRCCTMGRSIAGITAARSTS